MIQDNGDGTVTYTLAALTALRYDGPIAPAVDDYLLMERKARAWDELEQRATSCEVTARDVLALRDAVVHPAHDSSAR